MKLLTLLIVAVASGILIGWVDSRPTWDDAGVTAAAIIAVTFLLGLAMAEKAWLWALVVGGSVAGINVVLNGNYGALLSLPLAAVGSYAGLFARKAIGYPGKGEGQG